MKNNKNYETPIGQWRLTARQEFSAGHAIRGHGGKCERVHGHNFAVEIIVEGNELDPVTGMLVDFAILKRMLANILCSLDHSLLNETAPFDKISPSSENLARSIGLGMLELMANDAACAHATLAAVTVSEKAAQSATWLPSSHGSRVDAHANSH